MDKKLIRTNFMSAAGTLIISSSLKPKLSNSLNLDPGNKNNDWTSWWNFGVALHRHEHSNCIVVAASDLIPERSEKLIKIYTK